MDWMLIFPLYLFTVFQTAGTFNVEPAAWKSFRNDATAFGYRVIQANKESLLVSAPLDYKPNRKGMVYNCMVGTSTCSEISIPVPSYGINMSLGLSMSKVHKSQKTMVCGPTISRNCYSITTYNGMCFQLNEHLKATGDVLPPEPRDCPAGVDIVFLMDGSGSVSGNDFAQMKTFVIKLIEVLLGRNNKFAIMQYSNKFDVAFDFQTFKQNAAWRGQINGISQLGGFTFTPTAIYKVVHELFVTARGSRPKAHKILVVITDGKTYGDSRTLPPVISDANTIGIIRYAIGVGQAFNANSEGLHELQIIASSPTADHLFKVDNFQALDKLRDTLQKNIFAIEGTQTTGASFEMELAQEGFSSALLSSGKIVMGAVGAMDWKGGYQIYPNLDILSSNKMEPGSYLGYSMAVAEMTNKETYIILGAPRYQHAGRVVVFFTDTKTQEIESEQIGSYFGAEVCTVDLNSDSITDLLLISAPMYLDKERDSEGKVYVCNFGIGATVSCTNIALLGNQGLKGKFGSSLAAISDLNGDGISEVAVGAPLENNNKGSVYIFSGVTGGIKPTYSQRIQSASVQPGLHYFGQSISGSMDQTGDALIDIAVGSKGKVFLLRSRPVVSVNVEMSFKPSKIPVTDCSGTTPIAANVCFSMHRHTQDIIELEARVSYTLKLDATRTRFRAHFTPTNQTQENVLSLKKDRQCHDTNFFIADCPEDALNPLLNELTFSFVGLPSKEPLSKNLSPILAPQSQSTIYTLEFERDCGTDNKCIDDLKVDFNFSGASEVQVGIASVLNVTVSVENRGEDSYNSHVIFTYPPGLSYRRITVVQAPSKRAVVQCNALDGADGTTMGKCVCFINKPVFKRNARVIFIISFGIDQSSHFDQIVTFTANATSGNDQHMGNENFVMKMIKVKYNIYMLIKGLEETTSYINFTAGKNDLKTPVLHSFEVVNYIRDLNASVTFKVPIKLGEKNIWSNVRSIQIPGCLTEEDEEPKLTNFIEKLKKDPIVDCTVSVCRVIRCSMHLQKDHKYSRNISGEVSSGWIEQTKLTSLHLVSRAALDYDRNQFIYISSSSQNTTPTTEVGTRVEVYTEPNFTKEIVGGAVAGLLLLALLTAGLYKAGFFKSQYKQMLENNGEADGDAGDADGGVGDTAPAAPQ
ncbi:hypothetical protein SKAU_G00131670 [Synaphobranchus kaupii]|uniref:VWFA domain-containing protein n=1 Tax=Synaphobranchus kaupii TaxID=118154 RepID=A0A9Q1FR25_SYNKA|nr:hypothetical protein SKAU_G00131670 [Synaphobranchus kaupii]